MVRAIISLPDAGLTHNEHGSGMASHLFRKFHYALQRRAANDQSQRQHPLERLVRSRRQECWSMEGRSWIRHRSAINSAATAFYKQ